MPPEDFAENAGDSDITPYVVKPCSCGAPVRKEYGVRGMRIFLKLIHIQEIGTQIADHPLRT